MSKPRIEIKHSKPKMQRQSRRDTVSTDDLETMLHSESMRSKHRRIDRLNHAVTTMHKRIYNYLDANVGKPVADVRSAFVRDMLTGLGRSVAYDMRRAFEQKVVRLDDESRHWLLGLKLGTEVHAFIEDDHGILRKQDIPTRHYPRPAQSLYPVPRKDWENAGLPEAWELRNGNWFRIAFYQDPGPLLFGMLYKDTASFRTNHHPDFKHIKASVASRVSCSSEEIRKRILPMLQRLHIEPVDMATT